MRPMTRHVCDVVIPTRNRPEALSRCFDGLRAQTHSDFGVIVVDDASDRPVADGLPPDALSGLDVQFLRMPEPGGPAAARNAGVAASTADYVCFIDDDVFANPEFLEAHLRAVTRPHDPAIPVVSCGGFVQPADWAPTPWNVWEARQARKEIEHLVNGTYPVSWRQFHTGNNCLPRAIFNELGGFDVTFKRSEDDEFAVRLHRRGCVFHFEPEAIAWHYSNRSLESWLAIPAAYAYYDVDIDRRYPEEGYLTHKKHELANRRLPLRAVRRLFGGRRRQLGIRCAVAAAKGLYRVQLVGLSLGALSVAYDLSYVHSMEISEAALGRTDPVH